MRVHALMNIKRLSANPYSNEHIHTQAIRVTITDSIVIYTLACKRFINNYNKT